jgi:hypothetical protein
VPAPRAKISGACMSAQAKLDKDAGSVACRTGRHSLTLASPNRPARERLGTPPSAGIRAHTAWSMDSPQLLHFMIAVEDILTIVECSPQLGHTDVSSKRCRQ